jgi:diguanylate cyclase (GGDEF)-like protein
MTTHPVPVRPWLDRDSELRLLLIEDSSSDSDLIRAVLEDELPQASIAVATNLEDALLRLGEERFHATLADLSLPDADGLAVVRAVRSAHPDTALLVLTGRADGVLDLWSLAEGAQDYLVKGRVDGPRLATALLHALQRQRSEAEGRHYLQLANGLLDAIEAPTCAVGADSRIVAVNEAWRSYTLVNGGKPEASQEGNSYLSVCDQVGTYDADANSAGIVLGGLRDVLAGKRERFQYEYPCHTPLAQCWFSVRIKAAQIGGAEGAVISHVDVTAMHLVQERLAHQTLHDDLTGLPNRLLLTDRLNQALAECNRRGGEVGVAFIDLDHFKRINDSLGHRAGDELLVRVARRFGQQIRDSDTVARYSGDEFVVVWRNLGAIEEAEVLSERLAECLREPFTLEGTTVHISASIGVVVGRPPRSAENLLLSADAAMYDAKRKGRGCVRVYTDELQQGAHERLTTEVALDAALAREELVLHYQPVIDLQTGQPVAIEALARWQHPTRGLLGPGHFIPVAEASGVIVSLDRWALRQACRDTVSLGGPSADLAVAVNLSVRQLTQPDVVQNVRETLRVTGLPPHRLMLEITESAMVEDEEAAAATLAGLADLGVGIAIDDFGTGYSSLLYLRRYPITAIKIDRVFVSGIQATTDDAAICASVVSLAHAVGAKSIAEGVETLEQYRALRACGCGQAQGFLWSPAVPIADLPAVLDACRHSPVPASRAPAAA